MRTVAEILSRKAKSVPHPPVPPVVFRIGVTGHRPNRLNPDTSALVEQLASISAHIQRQVIASSTTHDGVGTPRLQLISSLAEGADRMAAHCALRLGYELQVPLPFPRVE